MKTGAENRKKTIIAGALGAAGLVCLFRVYSVVFGGPDTPPPTTPAPAAVHATVPTTGAGNSRAGSGQPETPGGAVPGVEATMLASINSSLDPTLKDAAMLRTENLVYTGTGRNIFSATYTPPAPVATAFKAPIGPPPRPVPPPNPGPPPPAPLPPINLKFFGTATRSNGVRQAFLLSGDDVYLASQGDIVARKYKIVMINAGSISVTDLTNNNTQTLPLQAN